MKLSNFDWFVYALLVAGKTAKFGEQKVLAMKSINDDLETLLKEHLKQDSLVDFLKNHKTGKYNLLEKTFNYIFQNPIKIENYSIKDLEKIPGVGPKTARFFRSLVNPSEMDFAIIDTHILKWLKDNNYKTSNNYHENEKSFLKAAQDLNLTPYELDRKIWYSKNVSSNGLQKYEKGLNVIKE